MFEPVKVIDEEQISALSTLAGEIWREFFPGIISNSQIEYMLEKYQSPSAIQQQICNGFHYSLVKQESQLIGYLGYSIDKQQSTLNLSKFYLVKSKRGLGIGKKLINRLKPIASEEGCRWIELTVNKNNTSVRQYQSIGFKIKESITIDIGGGFVMDDYLMRLSVMPD